MRTLRRILIVEDEPDLAELVSYNLRRAGFETDCAADGQVAIEKIRAHVPDLMVLDLMLPRVSGWDIAREVRADPRTASLPIIMLTARASEADQLAGLQTGADDYLTKPFSMKVLLARIEALLRRTTAPDARPEVLKLGPIEADVATYDVRVDGEPVKTTLTEFRILASLLRSGGKVLSRYDLMAAAMGPGVMVTTRTIDVHVAALRRKLGRHGALIHTVRGVGYRLAASPTDERDESGGGGGGGNGGGAVGEKRQRCLELPV